MNTSETTRFAILMALLALACIVAAANVLILARLAARRRVSRLGLVLWPALLVGGVLCVVDAFRWEPDWVQVTRHRFQTSKLPKGSRFRIVHLTDFHLHGGLNSRDHRAIGYARQTRPDVIVLTGDYTADDDPSSLSGLASLSRKLSDVATTYSVEGNWDGPADTDALSKGGVHYLREWVRLQCRDGGHVALGPAGWYDGRTPGPPGHLFSVALCHSPWHLEALAKRGVDLVLSGHTHGGQVRLPILGALLPEKRLVGDYQAGFYRSGDCLMYVNRGIGLEGAGAPKIRFWCRPEVAVFDIVGTGGGR